MRLDPAPRLPRVPLWALAAVLAFSALAGAEALLERHWGVEVATCMFKRLTGHPCPTCGATRGALALLAGHPWRAFLWNPLLMTAGLLVAAWFAFRAATGLAPRFEWTRKERTLALCGLAAAVLANWIYLILMGI